MALSLRNSYTTPATSAKIQAGVSVVAGDLIIVAYRDDGSGGLNLTSCADNASGGSNTYREAGIGNYISNTTGEIHLYYALAKATETLTITLTNVVTGSYYAVVTVHVVSGALQNLSNILDAYAYDIAEGSSTTAHTSASITTTNANDYIFTFWSQDATNSISLTENGTGFTKRQENTVWTVAGPSTSFDKIVSSTGTYSQTITSSAATFENNLIAAFKEAVSGVAVSAFQSGSFQNDSFQFVTSSYNATTMFISF